MFCIAANKSILLGTATSFDDAEGMSAPLLQSGQKQRRIGEQPVPMSLDKSRRGRGHGDDEVRGVLAEQGGQIVGERRVIGFAGKPCRLQRRFEQIDFVWELSGQFGTEMLGIFTPRGSSRPKE